MIKADRCPACGHWIVVRVEENQFGKNSYLEFMLTHAFFRAWLEHLLQFHSRPSIKSIFN